MNFCDIIGYDIALFTKDTEEGGVLSDRYRIDLVDTEEPTFKTIFETKIKNYKMVFFYKYNHRKNNFFDSFRISVSASWIYDKTYYHNYYKKNMKNGVP